VVCTAIAKIKLQADLTSERGQNRRSTHSTFDAPFNAINSGAPPSATTARERDPFYESVYDVRGG